MAHPGQVHPDLAALGSSAAQLTPAEQVRLFAEASLRLRGLFRTRNPVFTLPGPVALLREIAIRGAVEQRMLVLVSGPEGAALADTAEGLGKEVLRLEVPPGRAVLPEYLARFIANPPVDTVGLVHAETGTGVLAPLAELAQVVRRQRDVLLFVDAGASLGASPLETDLWGLDVVLGASEGPLGLPAGLGFAALSPRLLARVRALGGRGRHLDLVAHYEAAERGQALAPVAPGLVAALAEQLRRILEVEGLEARWRRHEALRAMVEEWTARRGVEIVAEPGRRAHAVSVLKLADRLFTLWHAGDLDAASLARYLDQLEGQLLPPAP